MFHGPRSLLGVGSTLLLLAIAGELGVRADDWPRWRGESIDSISRETGLLKKWPKAGPAEVRTAKNLGTGFGGPSIALGKIFGVGHRDGKDGIWALKEADCSELWYTPISAGKIAAPNTGPGSTPTYHEGKVYTVTSDGTVACVEAASGKILWSKSYLKDFGGSIPAWAYNDSVLIDGDKVICVPCGEKAAVAALKASTGELVWKATAGKIGGGGGYSSPIKATIGGVPTYVVLLGQTAGLVGVHAETGKLLWQYNKTGFGGTAQIPTPIIKGDRVWYSTSYGGGGAGLLQLVADGPDKFTVKEIKTYKKKDLNNHHGGMILMGDYIYFGHDQNKGFPACVHFNTGEIAWKAEEQLPGGDGSAAYLCADGLLYIRYQNGLLALVQPSPKQEDFKVISSFKLPRPDDEKHAESWPHPVIANGLLYIRDQRVMHVYDVKGK
jgi:outer membrane protein assembly factor BamB